MTFEDVAEILLRVRGQPSDIPPEPGVYAVFVANSPQLPDIEVDSSGLLFIGMSKSNLRNRIGFMHRQSGFSTLRRSLGAILKEQLGLRAVPLIQSALPTNLRHYQFADETLLDAWMRSHLTYGFSNVERHIRHIEKSLIKGLRPPLNLIGWKNPQAEKLMSLRDICRSEAQPSQDGHGHLGLTAETHLDRPILFAKRPATT